MAPGPGSGLLPGREVRPRWVVKRRRRRAKPSAERQRAVGRLLSAVPCKNAAIKVEPAAGGLLVSVPVRRPGWLVPPISWVLPWSPFRRIALDEPGSEVLNLCDGKRTVEEVVERFAQSHKLSFRESQIAVTQFLRELLRRGVVALVGVSTAGGSGTIGREPEGPQ